MSEIFRPKFHFAPRRNWINDPNGMVFFQGEYHLYFQHNPSGNSWGNMSWGHASSGDLLKWKELPLAIKYDDSEAIFSGSIVVDHRNSLNLPRALLPTLVAVYTSATPNGIQNQSLALSLDGGYSWEKFAKNPVINRNSTAFRDPKVSWYDSPDGSGFWLMVVAEAKNNEILFYRSNNLKDWSHLSTFGSINEPQGLWECPDFFPLNVDGDNQQQMWVLLVSVDLGRETEGTSTQFIVGDFDGKSFTPCAETRLQKLDYGQDFYAAVSFNNIQDGRRIIIGWMNNWNYAADIPTSPWRGSMTLPRELSLTKIEGELKLVQKPAIELKKIRSQQMLHIVEAETVLENKQFSISRYCELEISIELKNSTKICINLFKSEWGVTRLSYDVSSETLTLDRIHFGDTQFSKSFQSKVTAPLKLQHGNLELRIVVDSSSLEIFAQDGAISMTSLFFSKSKDLHCEILSNGIFKVRTFLEFLLDPKNCD